MNNSIGNSPVDFSALSIVGCVSSHVKGMCFVCWLMSMRVPLFRWLEGSALPAASRKACLGSYSGSSPHWLCDKCVCRFLLHELMGLDCRYGVENYFQSAVFFETPPCVHNHLPTLQYPQSESCHHETLVFPLSEGAGRWMRQRRCRDEFH